MNSHKTLFPRIHSGEWLCQAGLSGSQWLSVGLDRGLYQTHSQRCEWVSGTHPLCSLEHGLEITKQNEQKLGLLVHSCDPNTWRLGGKKNKSSKPAWSK